MKKLLENMIEVPLPQSLFCSSIISNNNNIYIIGGENFVTGKYPSKDIYFTTINNNIINNWKKLNPLPVGVRNSKAIVLGNKLHLIGGVSTYKYIDYVFSTNINEDGTLGQWHKSHRLPRLLYKPEILVLNNKNLLLINGDSNNTYITSINEDGNIGPWTEGPMLPENIINPKIIYDHIKNKYILFSSKNTYFIDIDSDNNIKGWIEGPALPNNILRHNIITYDDEIFLFCMRDTVVDSIYSTKINNLETWVKIKSLPIFLEFLYIEVINNNIYLFNNIGQTGPILNKIN